MRIEVVWAAPDGVRAGEYELPVPCTVGQVLRLAAQDAKFMHANLASATVGVFGRIVNRDEMLAEGDRLEICRGPAVDPKLARRARAGRSRTARR